MSKAEQAVEEAVEEAQEDQEEGEAEIQGKDKEPQEHRHPISKTHQRPSMANVLDAGHQVTRKMHARQTKSH